MSWLTPDDGPMHYASDSTHRWVSPDPENQEAWELQIRAHLEKHQQTREGYNPYWRPPNVRF